MDKQQTFYKWLAVAAVVEWLLLRTISRAAIHVPKSPLVISVYTAVNQIGLVAAAFVALLALLLLMSIAWRLWQTRQSFVLPLTLLGVVVMSLLALVMVLPPWFALLYQGSAVTAVFTICLLRLRGARSAPVGTGWWQETASLLFPACSLLAGLLYQLLPTLYAVFNWPGPPALTGVLFRLGELLVIGTVLVWWWGYGRTERSRSGHSRSWLNWTVAAMPALLFALSFQRDPAMTGILTIWSTGITLFLPWPVYVVALWLVGVTVLTTWHTRPALAYAILLFISAGYAPQLSSQLFCALIGLWLLKRPLPIHHHLQAKPTHHSEQVLPEWNPVR